MILNREAPILLPLNIVGIQPDRINVKEGLGYAFSGSIIYNPVVIV